MTANAQSRVYGDLNPFLSYGVGGDGLVNGDTLSGTLATTATTTSNVGSYAITQGNLSNNNYAIISYTDANIDVTARPIIVRANNATMIMGSNVPPLTWSLTSGSLVNSDAFTGSLSTSATPSSRRVYTRLVLALCISIVII